MTASGLSQPRLARLHDVLSGYVERGEIPGLVALVSRHGDVHVETVGTLAAGGGQPMRHDTIFRIASITKLVTAVAAMILVEECKLRLDASIEPWLPELADRRVLTSLSAQLDDTVPALRALTLRDLLTSCMGFGSVMAMPGTYPIQKFIREYRIGGDGPMLPTDYPQTDEWLRRLGSLPWLAQPGERWMYQVSSDVLGVLVARVSGQSLGTFMRERIFAPLGMHDTGFQVPPEKRTRLCGFYAFDPAAGRLQSVDDAGAVRADHREQRALGHLEADPIDGHQAAETLADRLDLQQRGHLDPSTPSRRASHGHRPSGKATMTTRRQTP